MITMLLAVLVCIALLLLAGYLLARLARPEAGAQADPQQALIERVNELMPQTQCAQCGYPGCRPYATAIISEHVAINKCPPGGEQTIKQLADLLGVPELPPEDAEAVDKPDVVAVIDEANCIGCTLCIQACPIDCIIGAAKQMHTVVEVQCTGCELCLPPCPVDCIDLVAIQVSPANWQWPRPA